jgi:hypothetical protein
MTRNRWVALSGYQSQLSRRQLYENTALGVGTLAVTRPRRVPREQRTRSIFGPPARSISAMTGGKFL